MTDLKPPDYILAMPQENEVPEILASGDKENLEELKELVRKGEYLYKLVGRKKP